jgi:SHOCT-like domain
MATAEERMRILKMVENKQITAEDGAKLLAALDAKGEAAEPEVPSPSPSTQGRWFRVRVTDLKTGKRKVNVNIPLGLVDVGLKMGAKFAPAGLEGMDMKQILSAIKAGGEGKVVDVEDEEEGEHVEIFVE